MIYFVLLDNNGKSISEKSDTCSVLAMDKLRKKVRELIKNLKKKEMEIKKLKSFNYQLQEKLLQHGNANEVMVIFHTFFVL